MNRLRQNVLANFIGNAVTAAVAIATVPIVIHFLGVEAYGLLGIYASLLVISTLLTNGLDVTINREIAVSTGTGTAESPVRNLMRSLEIVYWLVAAAIGVGVVAVSPALTTWIQRGDVPEASVRQAVVLMGIGLALTIPASLYMGALKGLQRHVLLNKVVVTFSVLQGVGVALVLWKISPSLNAFFIWEAATCALQTFVLRHQVWQNLPGSKGSFRFDELRRVRRFTMEISGITLLKVLLTQSDKILLSRLLPLRTFGYYVLAGTVASGLTRLLAPLPSAFFPRFTELVGQQDERSLVVLYHRGCQLVSLLALPAAAVIVAYSPELLQLWTHDSAIVQGARVLTSLLVIGAALNGLMQLPYSLQLAYGWTRLVLMTNLVAVAVLLPAMGGATVLWGATGAAVVWICLNAGYVGITLPLMHRRLLRGELLRWCLYDVGYPLLASGLVVAASRPVFLTGETAIITIASLGIVYLLAFTAAIATLPQARHEVARWIRALSRQKSETPGRGHAHSAPSA